ncbi:MAG TPA: dienelactone hydrolase family protein [Kofleriaceae bacterium]|nr:dienelactone hydrolase family protein [Kofleriaceae bacterium]
MIEANPHLSVEVDCGDGTTMGLYVAHPPGGKATAGVLVLQEIWGVNHHIRSVADRVARLGFLAVAPDLFHRSAPGFQAAYDDRGGVPHAMAIKPDGAAADLRAAHAWLAGALPEGAPTAALGFCMGGRMAFAANALLPLSAAVSFYGGGIASALERAAQQHGPVLFFWGGKDQHITGDHRRQIDDAMHAAGKTFVDVLYDDADHGFFCDERPSYHASAARGAWALTADFLAEHLARHAA